MSESLPDGWSSATIAEVVSLNPSKLAVDALFPDAPVSFVPMSAVDAESGAITSHVERSFESARKGFTAFADGDVIMAKITPCMENGKAAVVRNLTNGLGFGSTEFHVFRPSSAVLAEYIFYYIRQPDFRADAEKEMTGSVGQRRVPAEYLRGVMLPIPPLAEQRRIVAKIEECLTPINAARQRLARVAGIVKRFRQSVLAAACSGRLTADWREGQTDVEPANELTASAVKARSARVNRVPVPADPSETLDFPPEWAFLSIDALTTHITSGSRDWSQYYGSGTGTFLMAQNVRPGRLDLSHRQPVNPPADNRDRERSQVMKGDLLITIVGANTGDVGPVMSDLPEHYVCQSVALMRPTDKQITPYLNLYLNAPEHGRAILERYAYGAGRPHLSFDQLRMLPVALPPLAEQAEIVRRVEALFALADAIETRLAHATVRVEKITQAVLAKAFRGELVPTEAELARQEGRDYEPASALLARVQAEREGGSAGTGKGSKARGQRSGNPS